MPVSSAVTEVKYKLSGRDYCLLMGGTGSQLTLAPQSVPAAHTPDHELQFLRRQTLFSPLGCAMQVQNFSNKVEFDSGEG